MKLKEIKLGKKGVSYKAPNTEKINKKIIRAEVEIEEALAKIEKMEEIEQSIKNHLKLIKGFWFYDWGFLVFVFSPLLKLHLILHKFFVRSVIGNMNLVIDCNTNTIKKLTKKL